MAKKLTTETEAELKIESEVIAPIVKKASAIEEEKPVGHPSRDFHTPIENK